MPSITAANALAQPQTKVGGASQLVEAQIGRSRENCRVRKNVKELNRRETKRCDRKQSFCRSGLGGTLPDK
jgi:hypothetical protein